MYRSHSAGQPFEYVPVPLLQIRDDGIYQFRCQAGHDSAVVLDNLKFELLFELGIHALVDGYSREAITSFTSSLEALYEFIYRVAAKTLELDQRITDRVWQLTARLSERQLGLYLGSFSLLTHQDPPILDNSKVEFRNKTIHKGYIPTYEEGIAFGNSVLTILDTALSCLRQVAGPVMLEIYRQMSPPSLPDKEQNGNERFVGRINLLTTVDVRHPREHDERRGMVEDQIDRVLSSRGENRQMRAMSEEEFQKRRKSGSSGLPG